MKKIMLMTGVLASILLVKCGPKMNESSKRSGKSVDLTNVDPMPFAESITADELKEMLYVYASDEFEGRNTGEPGQKKAAEYLKDFYVSQDIPAALDSTYFQTVPESFFRAGSGIKASENVVAYIKGSTKPEEYIVVSAHLDHVGVREDGEVFNGADDDGSGTVGVLEIAEAFNKAVEAGYRPQRSIVFLHVTGEEKGLYGSRYYAENPIFPIANTVADLNIDMIGRVDDAHADNENYIYLIGSDKLSTELDSISTAVNNTYMNIDLDYTYNDENDPNRFYYRSDHYNFAKQGVPIIFYFNGVHADYHKVSDTPDKINYPMLAKRAQLVFLTAWELANRKDRIVVDKTS
ncbi:M28 family metallopeptidase [Leeuwenhoekiella marinoflava]|uniref:Peptidase M28-like protein n=2 Tax=Leeuwenhoekiella marinoflava TaxID=988 RepID=A0A4V1KSD6_9FLAO|nr:M28 family metallopeptidase [Leeuwenhoekiella marinoflava]RXG29980.1 peptidase M28-like protein [Leeuwenhoekiella marinoflava]SHF24517.1 Peptidase family M28 [Leeuwenhoekiella marinoflava DSM 3653]